MKKIIILGIETSCDETAASVVERRGNKIKILSSVVASQIKWHKKTDGVVPEVAARLHVSAIIPTIDKALKQAKIKPEKLTALAVTTRPGLVPALAVGIETAKTLALAWQKPLAGLSHLQGHIASAALTLGDLKNKKLVWPILALVVSGGHTELRLLSSWKKYRLLGSTRDDAVGEAFDKVAKMLGLGYPGGPIVSRLAEKGQADAFNFPRPMMKENNFDFSYSGLKTAVLYKYQELISKRFLNSIRQLTDQIPNSTISNICASFQAAALEVLVYKTMCAAEKYKVKNIILAGGVAANKKLRADLTQAANKGGFNLTIPDFSLCTDNAAMMAGYGAIIYPESFSRNNWKKLDASSRDDTEL